MSTHEAHGDGHGELGHVVPFHVYRNVFIALIVLTVITVLVSSKFGLVDFGIFNIVIAMLIASVKALIVALFFMHLKFEDKMTWLYALFPIVLLVIMMAGIFIDNPLRTSESPVPINDPLVQASEEAQ